MGRIRIAAFAHPVELVFRDERRTTPQTRLAQFAGGRLFPEDAPEFPAHVMDRPVHRLGDFAHRVLLAMHRDEQAQVVGVEAAVDASHATPHATSEPSRRSSW